MAISIPIISEFSDKGVRGAEAAFKDLRRRVAEADGSMGKMKAGFGVASDYIKANAGTIATVGGAAIATFVTKAVGNFQDLALSVDKFRDATGLTLDQASRWTEVAGDIGIDAGTIETAINRMNRAASDGSGYFDDLGVELKKHKDGTYDPQQTFLDVIDALKNIEDPADKAKIATGLLGRGWTDLANLIEEGSGKLSRSLSEVSDAKLIDQAEVDKAENYRDAMDKLNDAFGDFMNEVGEKFMPILAAAMSALAKALGPIGDVVEAIAGPQDSITKSLLDMGATFDSVVKELGFEKVMSDMGLSVEQLSSLIKDKELVPAIYGMRDAWVEGYRSMIDARRVSQDLERDLGNLEDAIAELKGEVDERQAWRNLQDDIQKAGELALQAFMEKTPEALRASEGALDSARVAAAEYIAKLDDIPEEQKTQIIADLNKANLDEIERTLDNLARERRVTITARVRREEVGSGGREQGAPPAGTVGNIVDTPFGRFRDLGGGAFEPVNLGTSTRSTQATNVTVNVAGSVTSERDLVESVRKGLVDAQRSGYGLVYSNT